MNYLRLVKNLVVSLIVAIQFFCAQDSIRAAESTGPTQVPKSNTAQGKYALLVGINKYPVKTLSGPIEDIKDFKNLLVHTFQFPDSPENIVVLTDEKGTKRNILDAFKSQLIENAKKDPKGLFVFEFSGHGIQVTDDKLNPDEEDKLDEALVPYDVNGKVFKNADQLRQSLITDDELSVLLTELCKYTKNVIIVTDCCRSGTNLRAIGAVSRHMDMSDLGVLENEKTSKDVIKNFLQDFDFAERADRYVSISGSDASHDACETYQRRNESEDKYNGLMTHHLISLLQTSRSDITYRQLADRLKALVSVESAQNPQIEGDIDRYVFANYGEKADPFFSVINFDDNKVTLKAGRSLGIKEGAVFSFYDESAKFLRGKENLLASGKVVAVGPFICKVELDTNTARDKIQKSKAILAAPELATTKQSVCLDDSVRKLLGSEAFQKFESELKDVADSNTTVDVKAEAKNAFSEKIPEWNLAICADTFSNFKIAGGRAKVEPSDPATNGLYICRQNGQPVAYSWVPLSLADAASEIVEKARKIASQDTVRAIFNETSNLSDKIETSIWQATRAASGKWEKTVCISKNCAVPKIKAGDSIIVSVQNKSDVPLHISMLSLGTSGSITPLYPVQGSEEKLTPGASKDLTRSDIYGPIGHETFKIFASTQKITLDSLKQEGLTRGNPIRSTEETETNGAQLQNIILRAAGTQTRSGIDKQAILNVDQDWTTINLNFEIE